VLLLDTTTNYSLHHFALLFRLRLSIIRRNTA
jgi:hypothetical protein